MHAVREVDCWAVGSLLYQLVRGKPPFPPLLTGVHAICWIIREGDPWYQAVLEHSEVKYPKKMDAELQDLLRRHARPSPRLHVQVHMEVVPLPEGVNRQAALEAAAGAAASRAGVSSRLAGCR